MYNLHVSLLGLLPIKTRLELGGVQELNTNDNQDMAHVPRTIEVELTQDLVECCSVGDVVTVLGLVKVMSTDSKRGTEI